MPSTFRSRFRRFESGSGLRAGCRNHSVLADDVRTALSSNQIAVVIGVRGTEKSKCANQLATEWQTLGIRTVRIDASTAKYPEDLNAPLAEALNCSPSNISADGLGRDDIVRVIVDRCDCLFDQPWVAEWQEQWRAVLTSSAAQGVLATVLFGRPLFRQIAGGDSSPLLNAGRVLTVSPLSSRTIGLRFSLEERVAAAVHRKTGGHPVLTEKFLAAADGVNDFSRSVKIFLREDRSYLVRLVQDHPLSGRAILGELLRNRSSVHESALISQQFKGAHAEGQEAIEDLCASGLVHRSPEGDCSISADIVRSLDGLQEMVSAPEMLTPSYDSTVMDSCWRCLFFTENQLRMLVAESLAAVDTAWWLLNIPAEVRAAAEGRKRKELVIAASEEDPSHPLSYLTLSELFELVFANWARVFSGAFSPLSLEAVRQTAAKVEVIRNRLAHSRPITADQLAEFEMQVRRLGLSEIPSPSPRR